MQDKLTAARNAGKLKPYDLNEAQVGDKVDRPFTTPCEVIAIHNGAVVLGLVEGTGVFSYPQDTPFTDHLLCHLPIAWLKYDPIYVGAVLFAPNGGGLRGVVGKDKRGLLIKYCSGDRKLWHITLDKDGGISDTLNWTLKPCTITINGIDVPAPELVAPAKVPNT